MPSLDPSTSLGVLASLALFAVILFRHRRFEIGDLGSIVVAFFAGTNLFPALYITYFGTNQKLLSLLPTQLIGYGKYLVVAGLCSIFISCFTLWSYGKKAWLR